MQVALSAGQYLNAGVAPIRYGQSARRYPGQSRNTTRARMRERTRREVKFHRSSQCLVYDRGATLERKSSSHVSGEPVNRALGDDRMKCRKLGR